MNQLWYNIVNAKDKILERSNNYEKQNNIISSVVIGFI